MGFGGPVWHASVAQAREYPMMRRETLAREVLDGLGDASLGEWVEEGERAVHVRRRLTATEAVPIGEVVDVRGTPDAATRVRALAKVVAPVVAAWAEKEAAL